MSSRKRWQDIYPGANPFALPQSIAKGLSECCRKEIDSGGNVQYLWIHLPGSVDVNGSPVPSDDSERHLTLDEWLDIIDESASVGTRTLIVSVGVPLADQTQLGTIGEWSQVAHEMLVGIHRYGGPLTANDTVVISKLKPEKTRLFLDEEYLDSAESVAQCGVRIYSAQGWDEGIETPKCNLPSTMTCVDSTGHIYSCGLVLGKEQFRFGHFFDRKLSAVIQDQTLPHVIPAGLSSSKHRCNGCPPLMAKRLRDDIS